MAGLSEQYSDKCWEGPAAAYPGRSVVRGADVQERFHRVREHETSGGRNVLRQCSGGHVLKTCDGRVRLSCRMRKPGCLSLFFTWFVVRWRLLFGIVWKWKNTSCPEHARVILFRLLFWDERRVEYMRALRVLIENARFTTYYGVVVGFKCNIYNAG